MNKPMRKLLVAVAATVVTAPLLSGCVVNLGNDTPVASTTSAPIETETLEPAPQVQDDLAEQTAALEAFVEANRASVEDLVNDPDFAEVYSVITIEAFPPDTVLYVYVYKDEVNAEQAAASFEAGRDTFQRLVSEQLLPQMRDNGITVDPKVSWSYFQPDLTHIWTGVFGDS